MNKQFVLEIRPFGNSCDRKCSHCYQSKSDQGIKSLPLESLRKGLLQFRDYANSNGFGNLKFVFHGGEPLIDGGKWVIAAHSVIQEIFPQRGKVFSCHTHGFHSEHTAVPLLKKGFSFGVSVVPASPSMTPLRLPPMIQQTAQFNLLSSIQVVLTTKQIADMTSLLSLHEVLPAHHNLKFIPCMSVDSANSSMISPEQYRDSLIRITSELHLSTAWNSFFLEPISWCKFGAAAHRRLRGCRFSFACNFKNHEFVTAAIDYDGLVYSCNRYAGIKSLPIADISVGNWAEEASQNLRKITTIYYDHRAAQSFCQSCELFINGLCLGSGGCPFHAIFCHHTGDRDLFCIGERGLFNFCAETFPQSDLKGVYTDLTFSVVS